MIVANLYYINSTNGLFYYGVDYLKEKKDLIRKVLVKPGLSSAVSHALRDQKILPCTPGRMIYEVIKSGTRGDVVYTPTPHPLPYVSNQWIVVHDSYPFTIGYKGRIKRWMLQWSLSTSRCRVAYINESEALPFVAALGIGADRRLLAPNKFPSASGPFPRVVRSPGERLIVGLVGTDSPKKNYERLFAEIMLTGLENLFCFCVYGHNSLYLAQVCSGYPHINMQLIESDNNSLTDFFSQIHLLVSVADQEGFGRPIAGALLTGLPCLLLARPVFKEFFEPGALFFENEEKMVQTLITYAKDHISPPSLSYSPPARAIRAYAKAVTELEALGAANLQG